MTKERTKSQKRRKKRPVIDLGRAAATVLTSLHKGSLGEISIKESNVEPTSRIDKKKNTQAGTKSGPEKVGDTVRKLPRFASMKKQAITIF